MLITEIKKIGLDLTDGDEAYCVFDTDSNFTKNNIIDKARRLALENNIKVITSTPSIEIWFLLHYEYTTASLNNKDLLERLRKFYQHYDKNVDIYQDISNNVEEAIKRAKKLEKYQVDNGKIIGTVAANPSTEIYKVVENLLSK